MTSLTVPADTPTGMGNCGIIAVAMLAGVSHATALAAVDFARRNRIGTRALKGQELTRGFGDGWQGATTQMMREHALSRLGVQFEPHHRPTQGNRRQQLRSFARSVPAGVAMMVSVRGHTMILQDGLIFDQEYREGLPVADHWCARRLVTFTLRKAG
jgi:hypothetical protein